MSKIQNLKSKIQSPKSNVQGPKSKIFRASQPMDYEFLQGFRVAHIQYFKSLRSDFSILDKTVYHKANNSCLGVSLRRFQEWFQQYDAAVDKVENPTPKAKKERYQNNVLCQGQEHGLHRSKSWNQSRRNECRQQCQTRKRQESGIGSRTSMGPPRPPSGPPLNRFKPNQSKPSSFPSQR